MVTSKKKRARTRAAPAQRTTPARPTAMRSASAHDELRTEAYRSVRETIAAGRPLRRRWDLVLSILGCLALGLLSIAFGYLAAVLAVFPAQCEGRNFACDFDRIDWGVTIALLGPPILALIAVGVTIVRYLVGRLAFWIPIVGAALCTGAAFLASWLVTSSIPGSAVA